MIVLTRVFFLVLMFGFLSGCKGKKKPSLSGDEPVEISDFIEFYPQSKVPFTFLDTSLSRKDNDSQRISKTVFSQFVPDSISNKFFGKNTKPRIFPIARFTGPAGEVYLLTKYIVNDKRNAVVLAFNNDNELITWLPAMRSGLPAGTNQALIIDRNFSFTQTLTRKNAEGILQEGRNVYALNEEAKNFMLIMTEALDDRSTEIYNPIDTLPKKNKWSGDYLKGKTAVVSLRDHSKNDRLHFFVHFDQNNGTCTGELKGEAIIRSSNTAEYRVPGDPCILQFKFSKNAVVLKEIEGCGSKRGLRCSFDGSYARKKEPAPKKKPVKK